MSNNDCSGAQVCDLYVVGTMLTGFCTDPIGGNLGSCSAAGADPSCATGLCVDGGETVCLGLCTGGGCGDGQTCDPISAPTTIEGVSTSGKQHCVPD